MGLRRRFERLLRPGCTNNRSSTSPSPRSASETRQCAAAGREKNPCQEGDEQLCRRLQRRLLPLDAQKLPLPPPPQFGRLGPAAVGANRHYQHQQNQQQQLRLSERRRGNHYASFSASSSASSSSSCRTSAPHGGCVGHANKWQPPAQLQFVRLEVAEASSADEASCSVAELSHAAPSTASSSAASSTTSPSTAVYEEIQEPLYDRVAACCSPGGVGADTDAETDGFDCHFGIHYWRYSSLPRRWQRRTGQEQNRQQQQQCPPLGCTQVDWRGVKCTSF